MGHAVPHMRRSLRVDAGLEQSRLGNPRLGLLNGRMPKRCAYILCALALLLGAPKARAQEEVHGPDYWAVAGVRAHDALNMRIAPDGDSDIVLRIPHNAHGLKNHGCPNGVTFDQWKRMTLSQRDKAARSRWCQVEYNGRKGWVAGRFLREDAQT
jgi:uncharacterized protein YgiM (DUF1202 family)